MNVATKCVVQDKNRTFIRLKTLHNAKMNLKIRLLKILKPGSIVVKHHADG